MDIDIQKRIVDFLKWAGGYMAGKCTKGIYIQGDAYGEDYLDHSNCPTCAAAREWRDKTYADKTYMRSGSLAGNVGSLVPLNPTFCACSFIKELERIGIWEEIVDHALETRSAYH